MNYYASTPFAYPTDEEEEGFAPIPQSEAHAELLRSIARADPEVAVAVIEYVSTAVVVKDGHGAYRPGRTIAARFLVLRILIGGEGGKSLAEHAAEFGCTRAWLSKLGLEMAEVLGKTAQWQRMECREIYAARAIGVHAGTWVVSEHTRRKKLRKAQRDIRSVLLRVMLLRRRALLDGKSGSARRNQGRER